MPGILYHHKSNVSYNDPKTLFYKILTSVLQGKDPWTNNQFGEGLGESELVFFSTAATGTLICSCRLWACTLAMYVLE